jgi:hypothetical protein
MAKRRRFRFWMIFGSILIITVILLALWVWVGHLACHYRDQSDMQFLGNVAMTALNTYYRESGMYPGTISILRDQIIQDCYVGVPPSNSQYYDMLKRLHYTTDGQTCSITWTGGENGRTVVYSRYSEKGVEISDQPK